MKPKYTEAERQQHIEQWRESGLTQKAYCEKVSLSWSSFKNWKKRPALLREEKSFAPISISHSVERTWVIETDEGWRIHIPLSCDAQALQQLFSALRCSNAS